MSQQTIINLRNSGGHPNALTEIKEGKMKNRRIVFVVANSDSSNCCFGLPISWQYFPALPRCPGWAISRSGAIRSDFEEAGMVRHISGVNGTGRPFSEWETSHIENNIYRDPGTSFVEFRASIMPKQFPFFLSDENDVRFHEAVVTIRLAVSHIGELPDARRCQLARERSLRALGAPLPKAARPPEAVGKNLLIPIENSEKASQSWGVLQLQERLSDDRWPAFYFGLHTGVSMELEGMSVVRTIIDAWKNGKNEIFAKIGVIEKVEQRRSVASSSEKG